MRTAFTVGRAAADAAAGTPSARATRGGALDSISTAASGAKSETGRPKEYPSQERDVAAKQASSRYRSPPTCWYRRTVDCPDAAGFERVTFLSYATLDGPPTSASRR